MDIKFYCRYTICRVYNHHYYSLVSDQTVLMNHHLAINCLPNYECNYTLTAINHVIVYNKLTT